MSDVIEMPPEEKRPYDYWRVARRYDRLFYAPDGSGGCWWSDMVMVERHRKAPKGGKESNFGIPELVAKQAGPFVMLPPEPAVTSVKDDSTSLGFDLEDGRTVYIAADRCDYMMARGLRAGIMPGGALEPIVWVDGAGKVQACVMPMVPPGTRYINDRAVSPRNRFEEVPIPHD